MSEKTTKPANYSKPLLDAGLSLDEIKKRVENWSGYKLIADEETKTSYCRAISNIQYRLECEISDKSGWFQREINKLNLDEGI